MTNEELLQAIRGLIQEELQPVKTELSTIKQEVSTIKQEISIIKGQTEENTGYIQALLHRTEELDAKFDGLLHNTVTKDALATLANKEDINKLNAKFDILNTRLFHQEVELYELKAVK